MNTNIVRFLGVGLISFGIQANGIDVTTYSTQADLEAALRSSILGPGISINSVQFDGALAAAGTFQNGIASGIGISRGIVLTSGDARLLNNGNQNLSDSATGNNGLQGQAYLDALNLGYTTHDATVLTINFTTTGGNLYFNYVFGSEEFNEWVGVNFNDVFGFFLDGTAAGNNLALLPGTTTPVSVNNVNNLLNSTFYKPNRFGDQLDPYSAGTPGPYGIEYDGFTTVLTVQALGLSAGAHTITLAIADAGDWVLDSGVFIQAASFSNVQTPYDDDDHENVPETGSTILFLGLAASALGTLRRKLL